MKTVNIIKTQLDGQGDISLVVKLITAGREEPNEQNQYGPHVHNEYEIYLNLSGEVSFMVDNKIYPVRRGTVVVTRPNGYHNVIFRGGSVHKHICILVSGDKIDDFLFDGNSGVVNLFASDVERFEGICKNFFENPDTISRYIMFFELMKMIKNARDKEQSVAQDLSFPIDIRIALDYIYEHITDNIKVSDIAKISAVSVNTLERHFLKLLGIRPSNFIKDRRLQLASELLQKDMSVQQIADFAGFSSHSAFITMFKAKYGMTPLQYKKKKSENRNL